MQLHDKIKNDVNTSVAIASRKTMQLRHAPPEYIGLELMHEFIQDLLGRNTTEAKIFTMKVGI
jgi:hypothetical protein